MKKYISLIFITLIFVIINTACYRDFNHKAEKNITKIETESRECCNQAKRTVSVKKSMTNDQKFLQKALVKDYIDRNNIKIVNEDYYKKVVTEFNQQRDSKWNRKFVNHK